MHPLDINRITLYALGRVINQYEWEGVMRMVIILTAPAEQNVNKLERELEQNVNKNCAQVGITRAKKRAITST